MKKLDRCKSALTDESRKLGMWGGEEEGEGDKRGRGKKGEKGREGTGGRDLEKDRIRPFQRCFRIGFVRKSCRKILIKEHTAFSQLYL